MPSPRGKTRAGPGGTASRTQSEETIARILEGVLRALGQHGERALSMQTIGEEAGVSRGTLYRYFKRQTHLLEAVEHYAAQRFVTQLQRALEAHPGPDQRVEVLLDFLIQYSVKHPETRRIFETDPRFLMAYLRRQYPLFVQAVAEALEPAIRRLPARPRAAIDAVSLAEVLLRSSMSALLLGAPPDRELPRRLAGLWELLRDGNAAPPPRSSPARSPRAPKRVG